MSNTFRQFTHAIVRTPPISMADGITTQNNPVNINLARTQHENYVHALKKLNIAVVQLDSLESLPDSHFVEDTALIYKNTIILTNPGAPERQKEVSELKSHIPQHLQITALTLGSDATIDGGDVLLLENKVFIGISHRTNVKGAQALTFALKKINENIESHFIEFTGVLHLKSGLVALDENTFLGNPLMKLKKPFPYAKIIWVPEHEGYAANALILNNSALVFSECIETQKILSNENLTPIPIDMSEFRKMDGSFTCLSLLW